MIRTKYAARKTEVVTKLHKKAAAASPIAKKTAEKKSTSTKRKTGGSSRSYPSMVRASIAGLHEPGSRHGSSYQAIEKYISEHHKDKTVKHANVMRALKKLEEEAEVTRDGNSYKLTAKAKKMSKPRSTSPKTSTGRRKKDPNAPKRSLTAFMFYSQENRAGVKKTHPTATFGEIGKHLGAQWKALAAKDKKKYEALAAKDKERYLKEKASYVPPAGSEAAKKAAKKKREPSEYNKFMAVEVPKVRAANPKLDHREAFKLAAAEWKKKPAVAKKVSPKTKKPSPVAKKPSPVAKKPSPKTKEAKETKQKAESPVKPKSKAKTSVKK